MSKNLNSAATTQKSATSTMSTEPAETTNTESNINLQNPDEQTESIIPPDAKIALIDNQTKTLYIYKFRECENEEIAKAELIKKGHDLELCSWGWYTGEIQDVTQVKYM